jgi:GTP-dependent dephospho-CoA kinase
MSTGNLPFVSADRTISADLELPDDIRDDLAKPYGPILSEEDLAGHIRGCRRVFAIGDMVNVSLVRMGIDPDVMIFDYHTQRGPCEEETKEILKRVEGVSIKVTNPQGKLTADLWNAIAKSTKSAKKTKIEVKGEEDLAALACIELADTGDCVIYGIPNEGISVIRIDENIKSVVSSLLSRMRTGR